MTKLSFKKMVTEDDIAKFWEKKRQYEAEDVFPNLEEQGEERQELIDWFRSQEYYDIIMTLHTSSSDGGSTLQFVFMYDAQNNYVGFTHYKIYTKEDGKAVVLDFCIDKPYRNQGIGSYAAGCLENLLVSEGAAYVTLNTSNKDNRRFWLRNGYEEWGQDEFGKTLYRKQLPAGE